MNAFPYAPIVCLLLLLVILGLMSACGGAQSLDPTPSPYPVLERLPTATYTAASPTPVPRLVTPTPMPTPVPPPPVLQGTARQITNVRADTNTDAPIVGVLADGETIILGEERDNWYRVQLSDPQQTEGWVFGGALTITPRVDTELMVIDGPDAFLASIREAVNVRTGPGTDYGIVKLLGSGDQVRLRGKYHDWYMVTLPDHTNAWVIASAVSVPPIVDEALPIILHVAEPPAP